ncbi:unnamed protein product, partial [Laminaria digitata]
CIATGNLVHNLLESNDPTEALRSIYQRGASWLGFKEFEIDQLIKDTGESAKELASLFNVDVASVPNPEDVLNNADRQLIELAKSQQIEGYAAKQFAELVLVDDGTDPLTGTLTRNGFAQAIKESFPAAHSGEYPLSVAQLVITGYDELREAVGEPVQDALALSIVVMLRRHFEQMGGVVCRLGESIFAVVLPACERADVTHEANACCVEFGERLVGWIPEIEAVADSVRIAMGV